jgi:carbazole 1,9a-dioxygenase terminal dioxygenase component
MERRRDGKPGKQKRTQRPPADDVQREVERGQRTRPWQRYLEAELGLRNYWYPVLFSHELADGEIQAQTVLGERLFFKRINGTVYCVEDRCLHRGVPFSVRPEFYTEHTLTCWFHGFTYDWRDGTLVEILSEADSALCGKVCLKSYPICEMHQVIFVWIGDTPPVDLREDTQPRFWDAHLVTYPVVRYTIKCNWRVAAENGFDAAHIYGHRHWTGMQQSGRIRPFGTYPSRQDIVQLLEADGQPKGIVKQDDMHVYARHIDGQEVRVPLWPKDAPAVVQTDPRAGWVGCYLPCGLQVEGFPRPGKIHFEWYVPIDEHHHSYMILHAGYAETAAEQDAFLHEAQELAPLIWQEPGTQPEGFNNFDAFARKWSHHAYAKEDWWHRERLFKPDYIIMQWRLLVSRHARGLQGRGDWAPLEAEE